MLSLPPVSPAQALHAEERVRVQRLQAQLTAGRQGASGTIQDVTTAVTELAAVFINQMLQAMRRTLPKSGLFAQSFAHDTYTALCDHEIARHVAQRADLGLVALLQRQLDQAGIRHQLPGLPTRPLSPPASLPSRAQAADMFVAPVDGQLSSAFGWRLHPLDHDERWHGGIDIAAPAGTPVRAAAAGEVVFSGTQPGYGNVVVIAHAGGYATLYAHNAENLVPVGATVDQGQPIATVGSTGRSTGPHLHFEVRKDGQQLDPAAWLKATIAHKNSP